MSNKPKKTKTASNPLPQQGDQNTRQDPQKLFSGKNKKNAITLSSAEFA